MLAATANSSSVAEHALFLMLTLAKRSTCRMTDGCLIAACD
jgi:phosphoglycerate dehydrogenase-like enzyme